MSILNRRNRNATAGYSVVDEPLTVRGELDTEATVRVDGRVEGTRHRAGILIIGPSGTIVGDIEAKEVVVAGTVIGSVRAEKRVEVQAKATVRGDVIAGAMLLHEGGKVLGHIAVASAGDDANASGPALEIGPGRRAAALASG